MIDQKICLQDDSHYLKDELVKERLIRVFKHFIEICEQNNIEYFLVYGTLLGAVRHRGMIPWDDDIDVAMKRSEFYKFCEVVGNLQDNKYRLASLKSDSNYYASLPKYMDIQTHLILDEFRFDVNLGVYIDIFIIDGVPCNRIHRFIHISFLNTLQTLWEISVFRIEKKTQKSVLNSVKIGLKKCIQSVLTPNLLGRVMDRVSSYINYDNSDEIGYMAFSTDRKHTDIFPMKIFERAVKLEFEGELCTCPSGYAELLELRYGNYMKLPPLEQRISPHSIKVELLKN